MKQPEIKFSQEYYKIVCIDKEANNLLAVFRTHYDKLDKDFIAYDTAYEDKEGKMCFYQIPKTEVLVLLFFSKNGELFTTIRRFIPSKEEYYKSMVGKWFRVRICEPSSDKTGETR
jgi:hypothetical protein